MDSSAAAAATQAKSAQVIYLDLQLHQALVSSLELEALQTKATVQVPGVGSQSFMNLMMQMATNLFIQQCRFNPQHNAESEQQLYNMLPHWLGADDGNLILGSRQESQSCCQVTS